MRLAETELADRERGFALLVKAQDPVACSTVEWFGEHRDAIRAALARHAAVFFRGFSADSRQFEAIVDVIAQDPLTYVGGVTPRSAVHGTVYTATDAPPDLAIVQHHEMSYHHFTPRYIGFYCETAPTAGGATPITDGRRFARTLEAAAPEVMAAFESRGVLFVRNYNEANFKGWREAWGTSDRGELESMLRATGAEWEWLDDDWLRTRQRLPAILRDPESGGRVLFSCVHLWHRSYVAKMNAATGRPLPDDPAKQPYATFFGDGSPIPDDFIALMHEMYRSLALAIPYADRDFLIVNNLLATHGRQPYTPPRKVYVTMREKVELRSHV
jgi:hypothetical protein